VTNPFLVSLAPILFSRETRFLKRRKLVPN
jgi:hypothetical protein